MTRAHKQARLLEPRYWTPQVSTVDGEYQKPVPLLLVSLLRVFALIPHVDAGAGHHAVPRLADGVVEVQQSCLVQGEVRDRSKWNPLDRCPRRSEEVAEERDACRYSGEGA